MDKSFAYCSEDCAYTQCVRNRKRAGPNAIFIGSDQFLGCHVRSYSKKPKNNGIICYVEVNNGKKGGAY